MGRPIKELNKPVFEILCEEFHTEEDIANVFNVSVSTVNEWCKREYRQTFHEVCKAKRTGGLMSIRARAFNMALNGNSRMVELFLKNYGGLKDKIEVSAAEPNTESVEQLANLTSRIEAMALELRQGKLSQQQETLKPIESCQILPTPN